MDVIYWEVDGRPDYAVPAEGSGLTLNEVAARAVPSGVDWEIKDFEEARSLFESHPENRRMMLPPLPKWRFEAVVDIQNIRDAIEGAISELSEPARSVAYNKRHYAPEFHRADPLFDALGDALGLTPEQIDDLWNAALAL